MNHIALILISFFLCVLIRIIPMLRSKNLGVDNWYWLLCIQTYKREKRFPIILENYLLEIKEQWYPPIFPLLIANLSDDFIKNKAFLCAPIIDSLHVVVLYCIVFNVTANWRLAFLASVIYVLFPFAVIYNIQLNPRSLAVFTANIMYFLCYLYISTQSVLYYLIIILLGTMVLLLHKMSTQLSVFFLIVFGIISSEPLLYLSILFMVIAAVIITKGHYIKVLRSHIDILAFWSKNINKSTAHQYYDSKFYNKKSTTKNSLVIKAYIIKKARLIARIFIYNPFILMNVFSILEFKELTVFSQFCLSTIIIIYTFAFLTSFVYFLVPLGAGPFYIYHALPFNIILIIAALQSNNLILSKVVLLIIFALISIVTIFKVYLRAKKSSGNDTETEEALEYIKNCDYQKVFCIPFSIADMVAYKTDKNVSWGGHGYGFKKLYPYYPIIRVSFEQALTDYDYDIVLLQKNYLDSIDDILKDKTLLEMIYENKKYTVFKINKDKLKELNLAPSVIKVKI